MMFLGEPPVPRVFTLSGGGAVEAADGSTMGERPCWHGVTWVSVILILDLIRKT